MGMTIGVNIRDGATRCFNLLPYSELILKNPEQTSEADLSVHLD